MGKWRGMMSPKHEVALRAILLTGLGLVLYSKLHSGAIAFYVSRRFIWLIWGASLTLQLLGIIQWIRLLVMDPAKVESFDTHGLPVWSYAAILVPILLGTFIPHQPLGAGTVKNRGLTSVVSVSKKTSVLALPRPAERDIVDWMRSFDSNPDPEVFDGQPVDVTGFVYHNPRLPVDQFMIARFLITCCVADASAVGLPVRYKEACKLKQDTWVRVKGVSLSGEVMGESMPIILAGEVKVVHQPEDPYLNP